MDIFWRVMSPSTFHLHFEAGEKQGVRCFGVIEVNGIVVTKIWWIPGKENGPVPLSFMAIIISFTLF